MNYKNINNRAQIKYQKTDFNSHKICQLNGIFICCKCKKYNSLLQTNNLAQFCIFCGTPNNIKNNEKK